MERGKLWAFGLLLRDFGFRVVDRFCLFFLSVPYIWLPRIRVSGSVRVHSEVPHVKVHPLTSFHLNHNVLARGKVLGRSELEPAAADPVAGGVYQALILADFSIHRAPYITDDALAAFGLGAND